MLDVSSLSDAELEKIDNQTPDVSKMSDEELMKIANSGAQTSPTDNSNPDPTNLESDYYTKGLKEANKQYYEGITPNWTTAPASALGSISGVIDAPFQIAGLANKALVAGVNTLIGSNFKPAPDVSVSESARGVFDKSTSAFDTANIMGKALPAAKFGGVASSIYGGALAASEKAKDPNANALDILGAGAAGTVGAAVGYTAADKILSYIGLNKSNTQATPKAESISAYRANQNAISNLTNQAGLAPADDISKIKQAIPTYAKDQIKGSKELADDIYTNLFEKEIDSSVPLDVINKSNPVIRDIYNQADEIAQSGGVKPNTLEYWDTVKRAFDKIITSTDKSKEALYKTYTGQINEFKQNLNTYLERQVPMYRVAKTLAGENIEALKELKSQPLGKLLNANNLDTWTKNLYNASDDKAFTETVDYLYNNHPQVLQKLNAKYFNDIAESLGSKEDNVLGFVSKLMPNKKASERIINASKYDPALQLKLEAIYQYAREFDAKNAANSTLGSRVVSKIPFKSTVSGSDTTIRTNKLTEFLTSSKSNKQFYNILQSGKDRAQMLEDIKNLINKGHKDVTKFTPTPGWVAGSVGQMMNNNDENQ